MEPVRLEVEEIAGHVGHMGHVGHWSAPQDELRLLSEETTELGLLAEESFKNAVSAIFSPAREPALHALELQRGCPRTYTALHQRALGILGNFALSTDEMRRVVELQQAALEFARMAEHARDIAQHALALHGMTEAELTRAGMGAPAVFWELVRQAYIEVRGAVMVCTARDAPLARRVANEDRELDRLFLSLKAQLDTAIATEPFSAYALHSILLIARYMAEIGDNAVAICRAVLYRMPPAL